MRQIKICLGSSCYSRGNNVHLEVIKKYIAENHLEAEISFSVICAKNYAVAARSSESTRKSTKRSISRVYTKYFRKNFR